MNTQTIKDKIQSIISDASGVVYTDAGSGCGGPGYLTSEDLAKMLEDGKFDDIIIVDIDKKLQKSAFALICELDKSTKWYQIEFNFGDNGYRQIAWIW